MPTGDEWVNAALKRFLSQSRISTNLIDYLKGICHDVGARVWQRSGLFTYPVAVTYTGTGDFSLSIAPAGTIFGTDSEGHTIALVTGRQSSIDFEDDGLNTYWVGMKYIEIPNDLYDNPRTGVPEYDKWMEEVGEVDDPTSVTDNGDGTITFNVNSIFESGVDHSGRTVRCWLVNPLSSDVTTAFEDLTVSYSGGNNTVTTVASFGQGTVSTISADYQVACLGVTVRKSVADPFSSDYIVIASLDSNGPSSSTAMQVDFSGGGGHSIQAAYDGSAGSGAGRTANIDNEAVQLIQENDSLYEKDIYHSALRVRKDEDKSDVALASWNVQDLEGGIDVTTRLKAIGGYISRVNIYDLGGDKIDPEEAVEVASDGDVITFTRGGSLDLQMSGRSGQLWPGGRDVVELSGSTLGNDGVYWISSATGATTLQVRELDFTAANLVTETGNASFKASIYRVNFRSPEHTGRTRILGMQDIADDGSGGQPHALLVEVPENTPDADAVFEIDKYNSTEGFTVYGNGDVKASGDYQYVAQKTFYKLIHPWEGKYTANWSLIGGGNHSQNRYMQSTASSFEPLCFPVYVPNGVELIEAEILLDDNSTAMDFYLKVMDHDWATPTIDTTPGDLEGTVPTKSSGGGTAETVSLVPNSTEDGDNEKYYEVICVGTAAAQEIYAVRIKLGYDQVVF